MAHDRSIAYAQSGRKRLETISLKSKLKNSTVMKLVLRRVELDEGKKT
jgi:hypothetical protein